MTSSGIQAGLKPGRYDGEPNGARRSDYKEVPSQMIVQDHALRVPAMDRMLFNDTFVDVAVLTRNSSSESFVPAPIVVKENGTTHQPEAFVFVPSGSLLQLKATVNITVAKPICYSIAFAVDNVYSKSMVYRARQLTLRGQVVTISDSEQNERTSDGHNDALDNDLAQTIRVTCHRMNYTRSGRSYDSDDGVDCNKSVGVYEDKKKRVRFSSQKKPRKTPRSCHFMDLYDEGPQLIDVTIRYSDVPGLLAMGLSSSALRDASVDPRLLPEDSELILRGSTCDDAIAIDECANPTDRLRESVRVKLLSAPFTTKWPAALFERIVSKCVGVLDGFDNIDEPMLDKDVQDELCRALKMVEEIGTVKSMLTLKALTNECVL